MQGLTNAEARTRLQQGGRNALTPPKQTPEAIKFLKNMTGGFSLLFAIGAVVNLIAYGIQFSEGPAPQDNVSTVAYAVSVECGIVPQVVAQCIRAKGSQSCIDLVQFGLAGVHAMGN